MSDEEYFRMEKSNDVVSALTDAVEAQRKSTPSYYAIVPAFVRYNKSLTYLEKILYGELTALSNKFGYCYATNAYFSENFGNSDRTIQRSLSHLTELGFISVINEIGAIGTNRKIYINATGGDKTSANGKTEVSPHKGKKQVKDGANIEDFLPRGEGNSTRVNSTSISISKDIGKDKPAQAKSTNITPEVSALPSWMGRSSYARLVKLYEMMWEYKMGTKPNQIKTSSAGSSIIRNLLKKYTEELSCLIIIAHFDWRGANGSDNSIFERMKNAGFPITWIPNSAPMYESFIKNYLNINTEKEAIDRIHKVLTEISNAP